jgi:tRNA threonylcarbamoyladenosine biosynthesis protein TsaE
MELIFSLEEIDAAAQELLSIAKGRKIFAIQGQMGAGKTTFIHALCEVMGVVDNISSPTFSIINQYATGASEIIYHMDLYRLKDEEEAVNSGVEDCLLSGNTCLVEWPEKAWGIFPEQCLHLLIELVDEHSRKLVLLN